MLKFGDIFRYKEHVYVYMTAKGDGVTFYVAQIVDDENLVRDLIKRKESFLADKIKNPIKANLFNYFSCFILLTTEKFENFVAFLAGSDRYNIREKELLESEPLGSLNKDDIDQLKREIIDNPDVLPPSLIKYVRELS